MRLPPPATGVELYLAAVLEEMRAVRSLLEDRGMVRFVDERISEALGEVASAMRASDETQPAASATKRTRTRTRGGER